MKELVPTAYALAGHPMPHCADPDSLYSKFVIKIYTAGYKARSAHDSALSCAPRLRWEA